MLALPRKLHPLAARADGVCQGRVQIQPGAHLVEVRDLQFAALADLARGRLQLSENQLEQGRLAGAIRADQADLVAAQDGGGEIANDQLVHGAGAGALEHHADIGQLGDDLAAGCAAVDLQPHLAERVAPLLTLAAQHLQPLDARHTARAPRFHALADPHLLLRQQLVGTRIGQRIGGQLLVLHLLIGAEVARVAAQDAAVQLDDAGRHAIEKRAVVGDQHHAALEAAQQLLQPIDGVEVEVIGRLVQQQHIGHGHQRLRQRDALFHAA